MSTHLTEYLQKIFTDKNVLKLMSEHYALTHKTIVRIPQKKKIRDRNDVYCHTGNIYYLEENHPPHGYELLNIGLNQDRDW